MKKSRSYMMLMKAPMMPMQEEESIRSDEEEEELIELEQGEEVENSEQSQMSYRPMSPKAPPLPPGLALQKESPMVPDQGSSSSKQAVGKQASVKGSKESVYSQGKSEGKRESRGATPTKASEKSAQQSPTPAKPSSRPPTRTSITSNKSKEKERTVPQEEAKGEGGTSRPRSEHEDPVTQVEIEHSEDEVGGDTERKTQQVRQVSISTTGILGGFASMVEKSGLAELVFISCLWNIYLEMTRSIECLIPLHRYLLNCGQHEYMFESNDKRYM